MKRISELTLDEKKLQKWVGRFEERKEIINPGPANFMGATLNHNGRDYKKGDMLPDCWHWLYFLDAPRMDQLGVDGHAALGNFLPPVALPRRMWAGARLKFHSPIIIGEEMVKTSTVESIEKKTGRSGDLCFVTVKHRLFSGSTLRLEEHHDIVYRGDMKTKAQKSSPFPAPTDADLSREITPSSILLFRYSALTFNGHRIHYDLEYCKKVEKYPGLVFHAPLTATLMLELAREHFQGRTKIPVFSELNLKAVSPLFHHKPFELHLKENKTEEGTQCQLWATNPDGKLAMSATLDVP